MRMDPQWIIAACAAAGLLITWTTTVASAALWLLGRLNKMKKEILDDFQKKHDENAVKVEAIRTLVIRHDTLLDPEFNGGGQQIRSGKQR
jgi:hypothetical protein